ncbi:MAG TPA: hypothetical protein VK607_25430, partial [Kofleriaceae bacterium]|nr:hypothetical protein [Kofleriaceae bacterium]
PIKREASGPTRLPPDAPRRKAKTVPPPPPGSPARKALEDKIVELRELFDEPDAVPPPPAAPAARPPPSPRPPRVPTGQSPVAARGRPARAGEPIDLTAVPEADKTQQNRGAVGIKHDKSASLTTNAASGTIGDTPPPIFDRAAIAAGQRGAIASERVGDRARPASPDTGGEIGDLVDRLYRDDHDGAEDDFADERTAARRSGPRGADPGVDAATRTRLGSPAEDAAAPRPAERSPAGRAALLGSGPTAAPRGTPRTGAILDKASAPGSRAAGSSSTSGTPMVPGGEAGRDRRASQGRSSTAGNPTVPGGEPEADRRATPGSSPTPGGRASAASPVIAAAQDAPSARAALRARSADDSMEATMPALAAPPGSPAQAGSSAGSGAAAAEAEAQRRAVPVGEFDHTQTVLEQGKLRIAHAQSTIKRDAASALLGLAEPGPARMPSAEILFDDPTRQIGNASFNDSSASSTSRFDRGDPTFGDDRGDATTLTPPATSASPTGTLRSSAALPRRRGLLGDVRYIATVVFGLRRARRELAALATRQATRQQSRRHHLITLGRAAVTVEGFEHAVLGSAREQLSSIEDERSQHAGHVAAADAELTRVRREREARAKQYAVDIAALDAELVTTAKQLEPLAKQVAAIKRRGVDLHETLAQIDAKIAATEASLGSPPGGVLDRAEIQAEIAMLRADRKSIQSDEPAIAGQLDTLDPRIAALEAARGDAQRKRVEIATGEIDDQRRVEELLAAIGAKRKVVDRAGIDAEARRDKILFKLGERLYVDRPDDLIAELAPIDAIDLELGSADRRMMELREILASVDRWKLARGIALVVLVVAAGAALALWLTLFPPW